MGWLCILLWLLPGPYAHAGTLSVDSSPGSAAVNLTPWWTMLEDPARAWTIDVVSSPGLAARFEAPPHQSDALNFGLRTSAIWLRLTLRNTSESELERYLEVAYPHLNQIDFYVPDAHGFQHISTGRMHPFAQRPLYHRNFVFPLRVPPHTDLTCYLRVVSASTLNIPTVLWEPKTFRHQSTREYMVQALYFGMLLALGSYNLLLFLILRDRTFFYYVLFAATNVLSLLAYSGIGFQFLWPQSPQWAEISSMVGFAGTGISLLLFQRSMLSTSNVIPGLDRAMLGFIVLNVLQTAGFIWGSFEAMIRVGIVIDIANMLLTIVVSIACLWRGQRDARFFLIAFSCLVAGAVLTALRSFGLWLPNVITSYGIQIGSALEMLLLSIALADRFNRIRQEKAQMQQQLVDSLKLSERLLEQSVLERTRDLARKNEELHLAHRALEEASLTDPLTGLRNRRFLLQHIDKDVMQSLRRYEDWQDGKIVSAPVEADMVFFMVDVDNFKSVNDTYGHTAGDQLLTKMGPLLAAMFRESDHVIRWGGEEFLIVTRGLPRDQAAATAARICAMIAETEFEVSDGIRLARTCSIGFAGFPFLASQPHAISWPQVVELADQALYAAKRAGRNGWVGLLGPESAASDAVLQMLILSPGDAVRANMLTIETAFARDNIDQWLDRQGVRK